MANEYLQLMLFHYEYEVMYSTDFEKSVIGIYIYIN